MSADTVGGVWTYALELAEALAPYEVNIALATMGARPTADQRREAARIPNLQIFESEFKLEWMDDPWEDVNRSGDWLLKLAESFKPDLVHLNGYAHGALPWTVPIMIVGHSCVLSWFEAVLKQECGPSWTRYREAVAAGIRSADLVVAPSRSMLNALDRHYGPLPRAEVISNARGYSCLPSTSKDPIILAAGRLWDEAKNIQALDSAAPHVSWPIYVAGEIRRPGTGEPRHFANLRILGSLSSAIMREWHLRAGIFGAPAKYEPFGLSILEAASTGCALVIGKIDSLEEIWGDAALLVPPEDPNAIAEAFESLIRNRALYCRMAVRAWRRALEFSPKLMASRYVEAYSRISNQRTASTEAAGPTAKSLKR
jgi:glycogen synthase